ncbi:MAG: hypothetical protein LCH61_09625 [Proteobacteria bacterium]|nr:hypothetical protein [Pseudomonadota bacterium]
MKAVWDLLGWLLCEAAFRLYSHERAWTDWIADPLYAAGCACYRRAAAPPP